MMVKHKTISCIIPAYNEAKSIALTLNAVLRANELLKEIIVIDDASIDDTVNIVKQYSGVKLITNQQNLGKSRAVARGILEATSDYIFFLDADLLGLTSQNIRSLVNPITNGFADVVISLRGNTPFWMKKINLDFMSGERILPRYLLLENLEEIKKLPSFGLEVFLNRLIIKNKFKIKTVAMVNVQNDHKWEKRNFFIGIKEEILMWFDIFKTISIVEFISQNINMRRLIIREPRRAHKSIK